MLPSNQQRIEYIDFIKGVAIFLVIWGHCIQNFGIRDRSFFENPIHILLCSFHMPIFMVVSGFFFSKSLKLNFWQLLQEKGRQLILPMFSWSIVVTGLATLHQIQEQGIGTFTLTSKVHDVLYGTVTNFWFIRSVFICYIITAVSKYVIRKDLWACLISILLFLSLPDTFRLSLDKYMLPFFWLGYFLHKHLKVLNRYSIRILVCSFIIWVIMLLFWEQKYYIYITGCAFYEIQNLRFIPIDFYPRLTIVLFRYFIGMAGSLTFFFTAQMIYRKFFKPLTHIGQKTLGIYMIHIILMSQLIPWLQWIGINFFVFNFFITPILALLLLFASLLIIKLLEANKYTRTIFLGHRLTQTPS